MKVFFFLILFSPNIFAQETDNFKLTPFFKELKSYNYDEAKSSANLFNDNSLIKKAFLLINVLSNPEQNLMFDCKLIKNQNSKTNLIIDHLICGYLALNNNPQSNEAYKHFQSSLILSEEIANHEAIKFSLISILLFYNKQVLQTNDEQQNVLNKFKNLVSDKEDSFYLYLYNVYFNLRRIDLNFKMDKNFINEFYSLMNSFDKEHDFWAIFYSTMGVYEKDDLKKATLYLKNSIRLSENKTHLKHLILRGYIHLSRISKEQKLYDNAYKLLIKAEKNIGIKDSLKLHYFLNTYKAEIFFRKNDFEKAYNFLSTSIKQKEELDYLKNNIEISKIREELQTEKKEKENLQLKADKTQNENLLIATLISLIAGAIISLLFLNNSKKKRLLAEQERALEKQKNINLLKEQELKAINAMIDGQEKERKRIAEDLHDNIGSVLATLKLHFENLKLNREKKQFNQDELYKKTESLIDETYLKVRRIAHAKNAGVIANQGFLVAVKIMAEKISSADKINIEVIDYGLDSRLENSLEITIFRIIQELTTNIVKHADAQNATINISQYDSILNIIVEDDGKGFDYKNIKMKDGIGLNSIRTRIAHLNGTFNVDSSLKKGTSIIIDIPIS